MKRLWYGLLFMGFTATALGSSRAALDNRIHKLTAEFAAMQEKAAPRIPAKDLREAQGILLLDRTKAGFLFAYQGGKGVAMLKDPKTHHWGPVAFFTANQASVGFQVGGQQSFTVILLMDTNATHLLTESKFAFGGEAQGTAGNSSAGAQGTFTSTSSLPPRILMFASRSGLFGGVSLKGGVISPDLDADTTYYERGLTSKEILFEHKVKPTQAAIQLAQRITHYAKK